MTTKRNLLLTGVPGSGKTTAIREILARLDRPAGGFYTQEIRGEGGREGFRLIALDGREAVLAHLAFPGRDRVGRYKVDTRVLESLAVDAVEGAVSAGALVVIDEIGPMELLSRRFRMAIVAALDSPAPVLGTIVAGRHPFADIVKGRPDVTLFEIRRQNQDQVIAQAVELIGRL